MYAKTLIPGSMPIACLVATAEQPDVLLPQLLDRGWDWFGSTIPANLQGDLVIDHQRLRLVVDGQILLDDLNPASPAGWWAAVDQLQGRCAVIIVRREDVDLTDKASGLQLQSVLDQQRAVWAFLPLTDPNKH